MDVLPCIVNEQWQPSVTLADPLSLSRASLTLPDNFLLPPKDQADACLSELQPQWQMQSAKSGIFCATFLVPEGALCRRINTLQNLLEVNRELATLDASGAGVLACVVCPLSTVCHGCCCSWRHDVARQPELPSSHAFSPADLACVAILEQTRRVCLGKIQRFGNVRASCYPVCGAGAPRAGTREMVPSTVELGNKAVIASGCAIGEHTVVGDKSSVKRSVVGASCKYDSQATLASALLCMNHQSTGLCACRHPNLAPAATASWPAASLTRGSFAELAAM